MNPEGLLQGWILATLRTDPDLSSAVKAILDSAPEVDTETHEDAFPYVHLGVMLANEMDTSREDGLDIVFRIHSYTASGSRAQCRRIQGHIYRLLHRSSPDIPGINVLKIRRVSSDNDPDPDRSIHGVCEFRALIEITS